jgi:FkbM family methyltransferase
MPERGITTRWNGHKFLLFLEDRSYCFGLWSTNFGPLWELDALARTILVEEDCVIDVGANYGYGSTIFARACGPMGKVVSVEAAPHTAARLRRQSAASGFGGRIVIVNRAVGDSEGNARMRVSFGGRQDCQYVIPEGEVVEDTRDYLEGEIAVPVSTLDSIVRGTDARSPALVKIDVEGFELRAVNGAEEILGAESPPWLMVEVLGQTKEMTSGGSARLLGRLASYSEEWYVFEEQEFVKAKASDVATLLRDLPYLNLLVRPPRGHFRDRFE